VGCPIALSVLAVLQLAALGIPAQPQNPPTPAPGEERNPPQKPEPGLLAGVELESTLVYEADPKTPHVLRIAFAGKDHARWWIGTGAEGSQTRLLRLRSDSRVFALRLDSPESVELAGVQRDETLAQLELRRALLQFESFEWTGEGSTRTATLGPLGNLRARFESPKDARPRELAFLDPQGKLQDSCRAITWDGAGPRPVPASLELWHEETRIWKETVRRVRPMSYTREAFLPRDRGEAKTAPGTWTVVPSPSPEFVARRFALPPEATLESARKEIDRLRSDWAPRLAALGLELENRATLELDEALHPRFAVLRLSKVPEKVPEGFEKVAGRAAVGTPLEGFERVEPAALRALREKLPPEAKAGAPYLRWSLEPSGTKQVLLLLSWTPPG
jgi:hypothetical protein